MPLQRNQSRIKLVRSFALKSLIELSLRTHHTYYYYRIISRTKLLTSPRLSGQLMYLRKHSTSTLTAQN